MKLYKREILSTKLPLTLFLFFCTVMIQIGPLYTVQRPTFLRFFCFTLISFLLKPSIPRSESPDTFFKAKKPASP